MKNRQMKKVAAGSAIAATIVGGSALVAIVNPLGGAAAKPVSVQVGQEAPTTSAAPAAPPTGEARAAKGRHGMASSVLDELVADGTITQAQADKIKAKMQEKAKAFGGSHGGSGHDHGGHLGASLDTVATLLGTTPADLRTALQGGKTLGALATEKGVDPQTVIDALVVAAATKIDEGVAAGKIDAAKAAKAKEGLAERFTKMVNEGGHGSHGFGAGKGSRQRQPR